MLYIFIYDFQYALLFISRIKIAFAHLVIDAHRHLGNPLKGNFKAFAACAHS